MTLTLHIFYIWATVDRSCVQVFSISMVSRGCQHGKCEVRAEIKHVYLNGLTSLHTVSDTQQTGHCSHQIWHQVTSIGFQN